MKMTFDELSAMELHEVKTIDTSDDRLEILRVPGGWIYTQLVLKGCHYTLISSVFVPIL